MNASSRLRLAASDQVFPSDAVATVLPICAGYRGGTMFIRGHTPQFEGGLAPDGVGQIDIELTKPGLRGVTLGIMFGLLDTQGRQIRSKPDIGRWKEDLDNPTGAGLEAATFAEAWRIVCGLQKAIEPSEVKVLYGI